MVTILFLLIMKYAELRVFNFFRIYLKLLFAAFAFYKRDIETARRSNFVNCIDNLMRFSTWSLSGAEGPWYVRNLFSNYRRCTEWSLL